MRKVSLILKNQMDPKYVIIETEPFNLPAAVLFSPLLRHDQVAGACKVLAAGFYSPATGAYGHSESLGIASRAEDTALIRKQIAEVPAC